MMAGRQRRRVGSKVWRDSGYSETVVPAGPYSIELKTLEGYLKPESATVIVTGGQEAGFTGTYRAQQIIYVNRNDATCNGNAPCETSIQTAMQRAEDEKLIKVTQGFYNEELDQKTNKTATLAGGRDDSFNPTSNTKGVKKICVSSGTLILEGIQVRGSSLAAMVEGSLMESEALDTKDSLNQPSGAFFVPRLGSSKVSIIPGSTEQYLNEYLAGKDFAEPLLSSYEKVIFEQLMMSLYQISLGGKPEKEALALWVRYSAFLRSELGVSPTQIIWGIAAAIFGSEEYLAGKRGKEGLISDAFRALLLSEADADETAHFMGEASTREQVLYNIISSQEFK